MLERSRDPRSPLSDDDRDRPAERKVDAKALIVSGSTAERAHAKLVDESRRSARFAMASRRRGRASRSIRITTTSSSDADARALRRRDAAGPAMVDHVALVYAIGDIVDGEGDGIVGAARTSHRAPWCPRSRPRSRRSREAVVLRIDSGGGSARRPSDCARCSAQGEEAGRGLDERCRGERRLLHRERRAKIFALDDTPTARSAWSAASRPGPALAKSA